MKPLAEQIKLDFRAGEPLYMQIARQVEQLVASGMLQVGDQLPTVRELATELRINFNTVARAYHVLDDQGLISTQRGRGTYIWEQPTEEMMQKLKQKTLEELARHYLEESQNLGYDPQQATDVLRQIIAGAPQEPTTTEDQEL